ncbi:MAG: hypothetical protein ACRCX2_13580 [Paraclostridium sp.]
MKNIKNIHEIYQSLERSIKAGLIHVSIRTDADEANAMEGELIIDYSFDENSPVLKVIRNGQPKFLYTESDRLFREFKNNVFQIGTNDVGNGYQPSIYFKVKSTDGPFDKQAVTEFYNEFKNNPNLKPYLKNVKQNGEVHQLYPYSDTNHVYFDLSDILEGAQDVVTVSEVIKSIFDEVNRIYKDLTDIINDLKANIEVVRADFREVDRLQDLLLSTLKDANDANLEALSELEGKQNDLLANTEKAIRKLEFTLTHPSGQRVVPVVFTLGGGKPVSDGIVEQFMSSIYIASNDFTAIAKIGDEVRWKGGNFSTTNAHDWILSKTVASPNSIHIYDVKQIANDSFLVYLRTGGYAIFNKYIEDLKITPYPNGYGQYPVHSDINVVLNAFVNGPEYKSREYTHRFSNGLFVSKALVFGNGLEISIEEV